MTCREVADFIDDYLTADLNTGVRREFERHLGLCLNCRRYIGLYKGAIEMGRAAFLDEAEPAHAAGVPQDLIDAILASRDVIFGH